MTTLSTLYNSLRENVHADLIRTEGESPEQCSHCMKKERLLDFEKLQPGNHVCLGGKNSTFNVGIHQVSIYNHHAIVKSVKCNTKSSALVTMIHFLKKTFDTSIKIQETTELFDLHFEEIFLIKYFHRTHPPESIIERATTLMKENEHVKYGLFSCNCEHFCHWCCIGSESSYQIHKVQKVIKDLLAGVGNIGGKILGKVIKKALKKMIKATLLSAEDIVMISSKMNIYVSWGVLSLLSVIFLIYTIYQHRKINADHISGNYCSRCCLREKQDLWLRFALYCTLQVGGLGLLSLVTAAGANIGVTIGGILVCSALSIVAMSTIPKIRNKFSSPFQGRKIKIQICEDVRIGDVISFDHWGMLHDGIVTAINIHPNSNSLKGTLKVIHYSLPSVIGQRKIIEEEVEIDLNKDLVLGHDYSGYKVHEPEIVVYRAQHRLGETKFGLLSNRSCHFCHWAKIAADDDESNLTTETLLNLKYDHEIDLCESLSELPEVQIDHRINRKYATKTIPKMWARIRDDVTEGQLVEFKYKGMWHKAVTTAVKFSAEPLSELSITVVHYGCRKIVCEETFKIDLNKNDIWIYKYTPFYQYTKADIIRRARARIGEDRYNLFTQRSSHLAHQIVKKTKYQVVNDFSEVREGDAITFYYWALKQDAIVSNVQPDDMSKINNFGKITVIHYALDHIFATRTVKEETFPMNFSKEHVVVKNYIGYVTYPSDKVVKRARSRIGEQRFNEKDNTSRDLVHWAKVVQRPVIISHCHGEGLEEVDVAPLNKFLLVPDVGEQCEDFRRVRVHSWSDLTLGIIVEYEYYWIWHQGILSHVDELAGEIKVIHYGANHIFAKRTIMEDTLKVNLTRDVLWIYTTHPKKSKKPLSVLETAFGCLGEQRWSLGYTSWKFCKKCVFIEKQAK